MTMENRNTILQELENISEVVASINNTNMYTVPANYFDTLSIEILAKIKTQTLLSEANNNPYSIPTGYFNGLKVIFGHKIRLFRNCMGGCGRGK